MSTKDPNLKVIIGADTKDFDKGAKEVKQGLKDLDKTGSQALNDLGAAFGVNTGKVGEMVSAVRGLGARMTEASSTGVQAFGKLLGSITPLGGAIAGLGLGAAIAGFKALKAEADNFKSTIDGMNLSMATSAYISTYKQVLHDVNSDTGKAVAETMSSVEKWWTRLKANAAATAVTWIADTETVGLVNSWKKVSEAAAQADAAAERNEERASKMADLKKYELELNTKIKENERDIAELRRQATDPRNDPAARAEAEARARELVNFNYDKQIQLAKAMSILQVEMDQEAGNTFEETKHTEETKQRILALDEQRAQALQGLDKLENRIAGSASAAAAAMQKQREEMQKMAEVQARWSGLGTVSTAGLSSLQGGVTAPTTSIVPRVDADYWKNVINAQLGDITIGIGFKADTSKIQDISNEVNSLLSSGIMRTSELLGNLIGTLAGGGDAWGDFKNAALSAFGDMAIAVGKIAVAAGLASEGIQAALHMDNPYIAIAAGAALIALGTAVKSSLSAVASGDYSAAGGGYSGSYGSGSSGGDYETREVNVNVTGTLVANGDQLITVINNTNKKNYYTQ